MIAILKFIFKNNHGLAKLKYLCFGIFFQVWKRLTGLQFVKTLFNGKKLILYPHCNISTMYSYTDIPDKEEIEIIRSLLKSSKNPHFIDIGANIGSYSVCIMDVCKKIDAFEPHPFTYRRAKNNLEINGVDGSKVHQLALSNKDSKLNFSDFGSSSSVNRIIDEGGIQVDVATFDKFIKFNNLSPQDDYVIKVDVEGFEKEVFEGASEFLKTYNILGIVFECFDPESILQRLNTFGFSKIVKISENNYFATRS